MAFTERYTGESVAKYYQPTASEDYMNEAQKAHFREKLMEWKRDLVDGTQRTVNHMQDDSSNHPDPTDRATQEEEFTLELRTRDRERKLLNKINDTLALIDSDDYGFCETCGSEIGLPRLDARPTATLCIDCKTVQELREKQIAR